jgi:NADH dehydrogenase [ubiquinone] 1 alpha subcomplex assembly factor 7
MPIFNTKCALENRLKKQIETTGPLTVAEFMELALYDPTDGYYATKVPIGREGDYITAPEMTQVFGEVICLWLVDLWHQAGSPTPFHLVEIGPGHGTLMADILRTFLSLKISLPQVHLVEISPLLKELQKTTLAPFSTPILWHNDLTNLSQDQGFCLMVANEFWDALPIQQFAKVDEEWVERRISKDDAQLIFLPNNATPIREVCPAMPSLVTQIASHLKMNQGAALFLDYGYDQPDAIGDTLQALSHHKSQSPLVNVGQADLTHYVDFYRLRNLFKNTGLKVCGPMPQGIFLKEIGLELRTEHLCEQATPAQRGSLQTAAVRLTQPSGMGSLFKVLCVTSPSLQPAGFAGDHLQS